MRFLESLGPPVVIAALLALEARPAESQTFGTLKEFVEPEMLPAPLLEGPDGAIYGTASSGGTFGLGAVFRMTADGTTFSILHSFDGAHGAFPLGGLVQGPDALYGTTSKGGLWGHGTVFKIFADGSGFAVLHAFDGAGGSAPWAGVFAGTEGALYGTTQEGGAHGAGTVFKMGADGSSFSSLHHFQRTDGARPIGGVIQGADGALYGTTSEGGTWSYSRGTIFRLFTDGSSFTVLRSLDDVNGGAPLGGLVQRPNGRLYGTTAVGGAYDGGTVFAISPEGAPFAILHSLHPFHGTHPQSPLTLATDGSLYGTAPGGGGGSVFKISPDDAFSVVRMFDAAASAPMGTVVQLPDGSLFGTTLRGGSFDRGTLYKMSGDGSSFSVLQSFSWGDGSRPIGPLVQGPDGDLYGTISSWGRYGYGAAFRVSPDGSGYTVLHGFQPDEGQPSSGLTRGADGALYGATNGCAVDSCVGGAVFRLSMEGSDFSLIHRIPRGDTGIGYDPASKPLQASDGFLYGTTRYGGPQGGGTIFRMLPDGSSFSVIHHFEEAGGRGSQNGPLLEGRDGALYGTAAYGGAWDFGTVFRVSTDGTSFSVLHDFQGTDGGHPTSGLIQGPDDTLYGVAPGGWTPDGVLRMGAVFALSPDGSRFSVLHAFDGPDGASPVGVLTQGPGGALYGTTWEGGTGAGTVFKILTDGSGFSTLHSFRGEDGRGLWDGLTLGNDGALYGTTLEGGRYGGGVLFRLEDDDGIQFGAPVFTSRGPSSRAVVTVTRKVGLSEGITVDFATSDGSAREGLEYVGSSGTVSFAPGQGTKTLTVQVLPASAYRGDRSFAMALSNPVGEGARLGFQRTAVVNLVDTKPVPRIQFGRATYTGIEGATALRVSVLRSGPTDAPVTVDFSTVDGTALAPGDYEPVTGTVTFASGVRSGFFTVRLLDDASPEPGESLGLALTNPGGGAILGTRATARLNVKDNDQVVQFAAPAYLTSAAANRASVTVRRTGGSAGTITVQYATGSGTAVPGVDYEPVAGTLTFGPSVLTRTFAIPVLAGSPSAGTRTVSLVLTSADPPSALGPLSTATLKIQDPNEPLVQFASTSFVTHVATGPRTSSIAVKRLGSLEGTTQVDYATSDGTAVSTVDYLPASGRLTFAPGVASQSVKVTVLPNPEARPDPTVSLALGQVDAPVGTPAAALLKIANGRRAGRVQLAGAAFSGRAAAGIVAIPVSRTEGAAGPAAVEYTTRDGTAVAGVDYTPAAGSLHFSSGDTKKWIFVRVSASAPGGNSFFISLGETEGVGLGAMTQAPVWIQP